MATTWLKLETNIPIVGTARAAYFMKAKKEGWSDQVGLYGEWTKQGPDNGAEMIEGAVAVSERLVPDLTKLKVITGPADGDNRFPMGEQVPIKLLKRESGNRKWTEVTFLDGSVPEEKPSSNGPIKPPVSEDPWAPWKALEKEYGLCLGLAFRQWTELINKVSDDDPELAKVLSPDPQTLQAAAATILIEASRRGLRIP